MSGDAATGPEGVYAGAEARALHDTMLVWDCLSLNYVIDPPYVDQLLEGGVTATNLTCATEGETWDQLLHTIDRSMNKVARHPDMLLATTAADVRRAKTEGKLAIVLGTQGSESIGKEIYRVGLLHALGLRFIGLAYTGATMLGDGCGEPRNAGLSFLGQDFVDLVSEKRMLLDLSHCGHQTRLEAAERARFPVCTHSNAYAVNPNDRNTMDEVADIVAAKGGVMGVCGLVRSVWPEGATIHHMLDHAGHYLRRLGARHVGLGLDFTAAYQDAYRAGRSMPQTHRWRQRRPDIFGTSDEFFTVPYPRGLETIQKLPNFTQELMNRQVSHADIAEIMGGAWQRCFENAAG